MHTTDDAKKYTFEKAKRLIKREDFSSVYHGRAVKNVGPLRLHAIPNDVEHYRIGLSVSKRVGNAVERNAFKRRLREAFRLLQHELPSAYDLLIIVREHEPLPPSEYATLITDGMEQLHQLWTKRQASQKKKTAK